MENWNYDLWELNYILYNSGCYCILYDYSIHLLVEGQMLERSMGLHVCAGNSVKAKYGQFIHLEIWVKLWKNVQKSAICKVYQGIWMVFGYWGPMGSIPRCLLIKMWHMVEFEEDPYKFGQKMYENAYKVR